mgnify:CR=1 FL=1
MKRMKDARLIKEKHAMEMAWAYTLEGYFVTVQKGETDYLIEAWVMGEYL